MTNKNDALPVVAWQVSGGDVRSKVYEQVPEWTEGSEYTVRELTYLDAALSTRDAELAELKSELLSKMETLEQVMRERNVALRGVERLESERDQLQAELAALRELSVTQIMLDLVPGVDGEGEEIYAMSIGDVRQTLSEQGERIEDLEGENETLRASLAKLEQQKPVAWSYKERIWVQGIGGCVWSEKVEKERPNTDEPEIKDVAPLYAAPLVSDKAGAECNCPKIGERFNPAKSSGACPVHDRRAALNPLAADVVQDIEPGVKRCIAYLENRANEYANDHGSYDDDTGATEFRNPLSEDYYNELHELADAMRALLATRQEGSKV